MEEIKSEFEKWKNHPAFAELYVAFASAEELKNRLTICHRYQVGPPELDAWINEVEQLFEAEKEKCLATSSYAYWLLIGMLYKLSYSFSCKCLDAFCKAIKRKWDFYVLWNEVGELNWMIGQQRLAKICFKRALDQKNNPCSLRNLSIVVRNARVKTAECMAEGIRLAKEAVKLDMHDGESWMVLGNAYLTAHFHFDQDRKYAVESLKAFKLAEKQNNSSDDLVLLHNMAVILKSLEKYGEALEKTDVCLQMDSTWDEAIMFRNGLVAFMTRIKEALKKKKPNQSEIKKMPKAAVTIEWKPNDKSKKRHALCITPFRDLKEGLNSDINIFGHIVWAFRVDESYPYVVGLVDQDGSTITVHMFNLEPGKTFNTADHLVIKGPELEQVCFTFEDETIQYPTVRVTDLSKVSLNGKALPKSYFKRLEITSSVI